MDFSKLICLFSLMKRRHKRAKTIKTKGKRTEARFPNSLIDFSDQFAPIMISEIRSKTFWWHPPHPVEQWVTF